MVRLTSPDGGGSLPSSSGRHRRRISPNAYAPLLAPSLLAARVAELDGQVAALSEKVATLAKLVFGASSEKKSPAESPAGDAEGTEHSERRRRGQPPGSRGHGRQDYSGLETVEELHDVPEGERFCPDCGAAYEPFGEERSEQIDWQVHIVRVVHRRPTYRRSCRCAVRGVLVAPPPPKTIPKGLFTSGFLARLLVEKYVLGRPRHPSAPASRPYGCGASATSTSAGTTVVRSPSPPASLGWGDTRRRPWPTTGRARSDSTSEPSGTSSAPMKPISTSSATRTSSLWLRPPYAPPGRTRSLTTGWGVALQAQARVEEARQAYRLALQDNPRHQPAQEALIGLKRSPVRRATVNRRLWGHAR